MSGDQADASQTGLARALRNILLKLESSGLHKPSFERLVREALQVLVGRRVFGSRSGTQGGRDLGTIDFGSRIHLEAKRYSPGKSRLKDGELHGSLVKAAAGADPPDVWVLATTIEIPQQLAEDLKRAGHKLGVWVELVDLRDGDLRFSALALLLAAGLETSIEVVRQAGKVTASDLVELRAILDHVRTLPETVSRAQGLEGRLVGLDGLFETVADRARAYLHEMISHPIKSWAELRQAVRADDKVPFLRRASISAQMTEWHRSPGPSGRPALVLLGEEGGGKTWAAIDWVQEVAEAGGLLPIVVPSHVAGRFDRLAGCLSAAVERLSGLQGFAWPERMESWLANSHLAGRVIVVIDGLNEEPETSWFQYFADQAADYPNLALLATCRTGFWHQRDPARGCNPPPMVVPLPLLELSEVESILVRAGLETKVHRNLWPLMTRPSQIELVLQAHDSAELIEDPSRERLMLLDWRRRYERRSGAPLTSSEFESIMRDLAEKVLASGTVSDSDVAGRLALQPDRKALAELQFGGILEKVPGGFRLHREHLILALALVFADEASQEFAACSGGLPVTAERLLASLEAKALDEHARICAAAIQVAAVQQTTPDGVVAALVCVLFALRNGLRWDDPDHFLQSVSGLFRQRPDAFKTLALALAEGTSDSQTLLDCLERAYLRWCDEPSATDLVRAHAHEILRRVDLGLERWKERDDRRFKERLAHLEPLIGARPSAGTRSVAGERVVFVESASTAHARSLAIKALSAQPRSLPIAILRTLAVTETLDRFGGDGQALAWLLRFGGEDLQAEAGRLANDLLGSGDVAGEAAGILLAESLPDPWSVPRYESRRPPRRSLFEELSSEDVCKTGFYLWRDADLEQCLGRGDVPAETKAINLSARCVDPEFSPSVHWLPGGVRDQLVELLADLNWPDRTHWQNTRAHGDYRRHEPAWIRVCLEELVEQLRRAYVPSAPSEPAAIADCTKQLRAISLLLDHSDGPAMTAAWRQFVSNPVMPEPTRTTPDQVEVELFAAALQLASDEEYVNLLLERGCQGRDSLDLVTDLARELPRELARSFTMTALALDSARAVALLPFLACLRQPLTAADRKNLARIVADVPRDLRIDTFIAARCDRRSARQFATVRGPTDLRGVAAKGYAFDAFRLIRGVRVEQMRQLGYEDPSLLANFAAQEDLVALMPALYDQVSSAIGEAIRQGWWDDETSLRLNSRAGRKLLECYPELVSRLIQASKRTRTHAWVWSVPRAFQLYLTAAETALQARGPEWSELVEELVTCGYGPGYDRYAARKTLTLLCRNHRRPEVEALLRRCARICTTDLELADFAVTVGSAAPKWFWSFLADESRASGPIGTARALTCAGFAPNWRRGLSFIEHVEARPGTWVAATLHESRLAAQRARSAASWSERLVCASSAPESWGAYQLLLRTADLRAPRLLDDQMKSRGLKWSDRSQVVAHLLRNWSALERAVKDSDDQAKKTLFHSTINERNMFPWVTTARLSLEVREELLRGG